MSDVINMLINEIESLKAQINKHDEMLTNLLQNQRVKCMTVEDIEKSSSSRCITYNEPDNCLLAAIKAKIFFTDTCPMMCPNVVPGVLYAPSGGLTFRNTPTPKPDTPVYGHAFTLSGGVWQRIPPPDLEFDTMGYKHFVTLVESVNGKVAVDWGLGQFKNIPDDLLLFLVDVCLTGELASQ
jgi:hypothetical protein